MVLTPSPIAKLKQGLVARGFGDANLLLRALSPQDVPEHLLAADVGLSFIKPCFSKISSSPTKIGEYLAAGLPVVSTAGIGDVDELLLTNRAGCLVRELHDAAYDDALDCIDALLADGGLKTRLHDVARKNLDLRSVGGVLYRRLYARLLSEAPAAQ